MDHWWNGAPAIIDWENFWWCVSLIISDPVNVEAKRRLIVSRTMPRNANYRLI